MKKVLSHNNQIKAIDMEFKDLLRYICKLVLCKFPGVPLEIDDLYYEFLYYIPDVFKKFDEDKSTFKTYVSLRMKIFAMMKCRSWFTRNHVIMNLSKQITEDVKDVNANIEVFTKLDISVLNNQEKIFYKYYFEENMDPRKIIIKMNIIRYEYNCMLECIKNKLYNHNLKKLV